MNQTVGQKLKSAREAKRLTLEKAFEATRIRVPYLQALEADDLSIMPSPVQARGYLRNYAEYLELDFGQLLLELRTGHQTSAEIIGPAATTDELLTQSLEPIWTEGADTQPQEARSASTLPKPAHGKNKESQPKHSSAIAPGVNVEIDQDSPEMSQSPKRRSHKKIDTAAETTPALESKAEALEEPLVENAPEPIIEEVVTTQEDSESQPDVSDNLWQSWLNRLSSILSARAKRPTLIQREVVISESDSAFMGSHIDPQGQTQQEQQEKENVPLAKSSEIFKEIGIELHKRRELLSLHLDEVERNTHVKAHYLEALEKGAMEELPSTVQTRGMLSNYAAFLDLDVDVLLLRFADALQARHRERNPQKPARKPGQPIVRNMPSIRSFVAGDMIFGIGIAVLLAGFSIWGVSRILTVQSQKEVKPTAPSISDILLAPPNPSKLTATPALLPAEALSTEATVTIVIPTQNLDVNVQVNLVAVERTYMRVIVDGEEIFNGRVVPGNAYPFEAENQVEVLVGSGAAIRTVYNGRDLGLMGTFGQVVNNIYLAQEIITPTGLPSPTITSTAEATSTIPPTSTLRPTLTPVPSNVP